MDAREIVDAYLQGRIESWGLYRKLVKLGLSTATALAVAGALPGAVQARNAEQLADVTPTAQESPLLDLLMSHLASQLEKAAGDGSVRPLAVTLARIGSNNFNLVNCNRVDCFPVKLNYNDGFNTILNGELVGDPQQGNLVLNLDGNMGQSNVSLFGIISPRDPASSNGLNTGKVNMNVIGHVGATNVSLHGSLSSLSNSPIVK